MSDWRGYWLFATWLFAPRDEGSHPVPRRVALANGALVFAVLAVLLWLAFRRLDYHWNWTVIARYRAHFIAGWWMTLGISVASLVLSTMIGLSFALAAGSRFLPLRAFSRMYVSLVRGTPLLVQILVFFYVIADAFHLENRLTAGVLTLSIFSGAYIAEVIRGGIDSVGKSQRESALAIGLTTAQMYRYVILPQALRQILPALAGQFVSLVKDSSLLSIISIGEFTLRAQEVNSATFSTLECYLPLAAGYLLITIPIAAAARRLEGSIRYET
jgi:polar amino acid transport system permease protein